MRAAEDLLAKLNTVPLREAWAAELQRLEMLEIVGKLAAIVEEETKSLEWMRDATARATREAGLVDLVKNFTAAEP